MLHSVRRRVFQPQRLNTDGFRQVLCTKVSEVHHLKRKASEELDEELASPSKRSKIIMGTDIHCYRCAVPVEYNEVEPLELLDTLGQLPGHWDILSQTTDSFHMSDLDELDEMDPILSENTAEVFEYTGWSNFEEVWRRANVEYPRTFWSHVEEHIQNRTEDEFEDVTEINQASDFGGDYSLSRFQTNWYLPPTVNEIEEYHNLAPGTVLESVQTEPALSDYIDSPVPWFDYFENNALQVESITTSVDLDAEVDDIFSFLEQY